MRADLSMTLAGEASLEIIAETDFEVEILKRAWKLNGYRMANGKTKTGNGTLGFYVPLFNTTTYT